MDSSDQSSAKSERAAIDKNIDEYDATAAAYDTWCRESVLMQQYSYYSTFNELSKDGVEGKTYLEVGCGPCPIGRRLANMGAKKIYGMDISAEMIENCKINLTADGLIDKFELFAADIFDEKFALPEQVDVIVCSYVLTTFINTPNMLNRILTAFKRHLKDDGMVFITEFSYPE